MRKFLVIFSVGLLLFLAANLLAAHLNSDCGLPALFGLDSCADDIVRAGWPLQFYEEGGIAFHSSFDVTRLALDVAIGLAASAALAWWSGEAASSR
jgi:hypothetical protein